jgi:tetratricopeptide (TPR) repeat protein
VRDYTNAAALAPNSEKSYLGRAIVFQADGQPQRALEECEQAVRVNPNSSAGYLCRAEAYIKMNAPGRAVEEVNRALVTAQTLNQPMPLLNELAQSMPAAEKEVAKDKPEAAPVAVVPPVPASPAVNSVEPEPPPPVAAAPQAPARAAKVVPSAEASGDAKLYHQLGREQNNQQKFEQALNLLTRAIELDPWLASAYNARGYAYLRLTNFDQAQADFSEAIRLQPSYTNAYVNRAAARRHIGDRNGAAADQRKAAELIAGDQRPAAPKSSLSAQR